MRALAVAAIFLSAAFAAPVAKADAPDPAVQQVQNFYDALLDSMKHAKELGIKGRFEKLKPAVEATFDLADMAHLAVGPSWATMTATDRQALTEAFERMTVANYASNFDGYSGEKFTVDPTVQTRGQDRIVQSKLVTADKTIPFGYRLRQVGGTWKILDIYLNGYVSQLATQRSDFGATVAAGGAKALIKKINALTDKLMAS
ncbi:MAG: ABC transporter substrate-binding protein [Alphaproteobacteria bacterium]|nr:ABC transporter substrate-binding protein [Alphaproteobacteria bacterium]MDE2111560.1 ABC transporter substrate-binding protein [Alphaproteobacteria bacterium]MDE2495004.1 ABC transporter substrate-binding protein [Alphaproteobacteria bacterium]